MIFKNKIIVIATLFVISSCTTFPALTPIPTSSPTLTPAPTVTTLPSPPPTPVTQILGRVYKEGWDSLGMSANINTGNPDSRDTHVDAIIPIEYRNNLTNCPIYSPVDGIVWEIYSVGNPKGSGGQVISIHLSDPPLGIEEALQNLNINPKNVTRYSIHIAHIIGLEPELKAGVQVKKGMLLAKGVDEEPEPKISYILYIWIGNRLLQINPCSVTNTISFCGVCYQYNGDCPETLENYPDGGIGWWDESDPFWDTHELSAQ